MRKLRIINKIKSFLEEYAHIKISFLKKGRGIESDRYNAYQKKWNDFDIKEGEKVLDVGSGGYPFPLATHIADYYPEDTTHRSETLVKDGRPFTVCSVEAMPFEDKEFDFIYCSHLLEHVSDPAKACEELMRVGKRGYIETPTRTSDIMFNFLNLQDHHKWYIYIINNTVIFLEWLGCERRDLNCNYFFEELLSKWKNPFQDLFFKHRDLFVNMFLWSGRFNYIVIDKNGEIAALSDNMNKKR